MSGKQAGGTVLRIAGVLAIVLVLLVYLPLTVPKLLGYEPYAITSGSMAPQIPTGSMVYAVPTDPAALAAGDVIVFRSSLDSQGVVTHRVVENDTAGRQLVTKGDANGTEDLRPVPYNGVIGSVRWRLPVWGSLALMLEGSGGRLLSVGCVAAGALLFVLGGALKRNEDTE